MPAITVSSVNIGTDEITAVAHGLLTGDRFRLRNTGGALPAATPALAPVTDFFAVRTGADTIKVATSSSNALAGTPVVVDITGTGSGTTTIEYGLPYCIPTALAAANTQVKSANDNGAWSALVALYVLLTGQAQAIWTLVTLAVSLVINGSLTVTGLFQHEQSYSHEIAFAIPDASALLTAGVAGTTAPRLSLQGSTGDNALPLHIPIGTLTKWSVSLSKSSASGTITARLYECQGSGATPTQLGSTQSNSANAPGVISLGQTGLSIAMTAGRGYFIVLNGGGTTGDIASSYHASVTGT